MFWKNIGFTQIASERGFHCLIGRKNCLTLRGKNYGDQLMRKKTFSSLVFFWYSKGISQVLSKKINLIYRKPGYFWVLVHVGWKEDYVVTGLWTVFLWCSKLAFPTSLESLVVNSKRSKMAFFETFSRYWFFLRFGKCLFWILNKVFNSLFHRNALTFSRHLNSLSEASVTVRL